MTRLTPCSHEAALLQALRAGAWPLAAEPTLRAHVATCRGCRETVLVAGALQGAATLAPTPPPLAGSLWWRAELRRHQAELQRAARPVAWAEGLALSAAAGVACGLAVWQRRPLLESGLRMSTALRTGATGLPLMIVASLGTLVLAAIAVYMMAGRE